MNLLKYTLDIDTKSESMDQTTFTIYKLQMLDDKFSKCAVNDYDAKRYYHNIAYVFMYNAFLRKKEFDLFRIYQNIMYSKHLTELYNSILKEFMDQAKKKIPKKTEVQILNEKLDTVISMLHQVK